MPLNRLVLPQVSHQLKQLMNLLEYYPVALHMYTYCQLLQQAFRQLILLVNPAVVLARLYADYRLDLPAGKYDYLKLLLRKAVL